MKSKKALVIIAVTLFAIAWIFSARYYLMTLLWSKPEIMQAASSPSGKYTAYIYESSGGATQPYTYHVSVFETGKLPKRGHGNAYSSAHSPEYIIWTNDTTLFVYNYSTPNIYNQKERVNGITINFNYYK